jgi:hypothetical protein
MKRDSLLPNGKNIKRIRLSYFVCILVLFSSPATFALDPIGSTITSLQPRQFQLGIEYCRSSMDLQLNSGQWTETLYGSFNDAGTAVSLVLNDFEQTNTYVNIGYCFDYNWEIFVRMNRTKAEFGDSLIKAGESFESDSKPAFGGGIKATLFENNLLKIGGLVQANMASYSGQLYSPSWELPHFVETDITEIQIAIGANYMLMDKIWIYGGPVMHFISGEYSDTYVEEFDTGGLLLSEYTWDIEQDSMYGGYIGTQMEISRNCFMNIEYQFTGGATAFGAGILLGF